jgi:hypothetical protein
MPRNPNNIQISLAGKYRAILDSIAQNGESIDLCAKRLLVECLDRLSTGDSLEDRFSQLENRIAKLEAIVSSGNEDTANHNPRDKTSRKIGT